MELLDLPGANAYGPRMSAGDGSEPVAKKKKKKARASAGVGELGDKSSGSRATKRTTTDESRNDARSIDLDTRDTSAAFGEAKKWVLAAAVLLLVGIGLVAIGEPTVGPWLTVGGMATALWGAHRLGRSGPDDART